MSLFRNFSPASKEAPAVNLPDPSSPLSKVVPSSSIEAANSTVSVLLTEDKKKTRGPYGKVSAERKAEIGRRAAEHGIASTVYFYAGKLPETLFCLRVFEL